MQPKTSSDGRAWSVGVDGGRKDGREFKLTKGEHLVRVTHERLKQRFFCNFLQFRCLLLGTIYRLQDQLDMPRRWRRQPANFESSGGTLALLLSLRPTRVGWSVSIHIWQPSKKTKDEIRSSFPNCQISRQKDKEVTMRASPGHEIIMLKIK